MPLSNAERQRRYIDRLKEQAREATIADEGWSMAKLLPPETGLPMAERTLPVLGQGVGVQCAQDEPIFSVGEYRLVHSLGQ